MGNVEKEVEVEEEEEGGEEGEGEGGGTTRRKKSQGAAARENFNETPHYKSEPDDNRMIVIDSCSP